ncbi:VTT domain-containing protein [Legionella fairfieldensis]|uniref:VTT domain-containing protein n=1 Tax=Legionella fairfieldensis TaxID=45064 RepID=UPI00055D562E|nr:VTT domain-containing protein [Legionella fairfieldensis]
MHLFSDYIQPLTLWLHDHPHWALLITFLIALTESLAIIGSIVPGSVTMTAIGILAGSGVMRIDLTLIAATLGAIAGDSSSYILGYAYSDRLSKIWPFKRYPALLEYGKEYFAKHGGKSVLVGRFVGPLRSIIPVIAGMMHMNHWRFFLANIFSAVGWAVLYVLPGVLIGTASNELSPEASTRLFILILLLLAAMWLTSLGLKWLIIHMNRLVRTALHNFWLWAANNRFLAKIVKKLSPFNEKNHFATAAFLIALILSITLLFLLIISIFSGTCIVTINQPVHLFLQSLRTHSFDIFFIFVAQITSPVTLTILALSIVLLAIYYHDWRSLAYYLSLNTFCFFVLVFAHLLINSPRPQGLMDTETGSSFPVIELTFATANFLVFIFYLNVYCPTRLNRSIKTTLISALFLAGFTPIYLGDNWLTDSLGAYLCGLSIALFHWILYRRHKSSMTCSIYIPLSILLLLFLASLLSGFLTYSQSLRNHQPYFAQYVFTDELWWNQTKPILPIYHTNRIGHRISLFNIQYAGEINNLEDSLTTYGWKKQNDSLFNTILTRVSGQKSAQESPLMAQLYLNRKPVLVMTYESANDNSIQILRIWRSNYHLQHFRQPLWIGSIHPLFVKANKFKQSPTPPKRASLSYLSSALPSVFLQRRISLPPKISNQQLPIDVEPVLLLIREDK